MPKETKETAARHLPERPSLEHLKTQAKDLLEALRAGAPEALERVRQSLPAARGASNERIAQLQLALHDAQSVLAREHGFASWSELKTAVERAAEAGATGALSAESLRALLARVTQTPPPPEVQQSLLEASSLVIAPLALPAELPVVPLRNTLLSVGSVAPIMIGRLSSLAALAAAQQSGQRIALFGQKQELDEAPGSAGLHPVGCVGAVHALFPIPGEQTSWLVVKALQWITLAEITSEQPYLRARVEPFDVLEQSNEETRRLVQELRQRVRALTTTLPDGERLQKMTDGMSPLQLADASIANLPCSVEARAAYAAQVDLTNRLRHVLALFPNSP
jgi:Lon protease-like protein